MAWWTERAQPADARSVKRQQRAQAKDDRGQCLRQRPLSSPQPPERPYVTRSGLRWTAAAAAATTTTTHWLGRLTKEDDVVAGGSADEEQVARGATASPEASPGHHSLEEHAEDGEDDQDGQDDAGSDGEVARQGREPVGDGRLDEGRLAHSRALSSTVKTTTQTRGFDKKITRQHGKDKRRRLLAVLATCTRTWTTT